MIRFTLFCLLSFAFLQVISQTCSPLNTTFTRAPQICKPSYVIPEQNANNKTGGDTLSAVLSALSINPPSRACAEAFSTYYCSLYYPECGSDNTSLPMCFATCEDAIIACANDSDKFAGSPLVLPTSCAPTNNTSCSNNSDIDLSNFYTDCGYAILNDTAFKDIQMNTNILCTPNYTIPAANISIGANSYVLAQKVFSTFEHLDQTLAETSVDGKGVEDWMYMCLKPFAAFYCSQAFPSCNSDETLPTLPICRSVCSQVVDSCANLSLYFNFTSDMLQVPSLEDCRDMPDSNCFTPSTLDTSLVFFFDHDPPIPNPTISTTATTIVYPPGGPAAGGGIGAAMIVGILFIVLALSIIMRRQDYK